MKISVDDHWLANKAYFGDITVKKKHFIRVLPTRWRQKPAGSEITSLSPCVYDMLPRILQGRVVREFGRTHSEPAMPICRRRNPLCRSIVLYRSSSLSRCAFGFVGAVLWRFLAASRNVTGSSDTFVSV